MPSIGHSLSIGAAIIRSIYGSGGAGFFLNLSNATNITLVDTQAIGTITSTTGGIISASQVPSRTTGVAPLYVNFDMTGTTSSQSANPTHELFYATDFGDSSAGTWVNGVQSSGLTSKNTGYGPITGHVYETPGTYTVTTVVMDGVNVSSKTGTIVVQDPNVVYAGTNTICISHSGNFTGAPSGSQQVNTAGNTDIYTYINTYKANNKRILFCKADNWTCSAQINFSSLNGLIIDGYGTGVSRAFGTGTLLPITPVNFGAVGQALFLAGIDITDLKICNLKITADSSHSAGGGTSSSIGLMFSKVEIYGAQGGWNINASQNPVSVVPEQTCFYECVVDDLYGEPFYDTPSVTAAFDATTDIFSAISHIFSINQPVVLRGTVPAGLTSDNAATYYISATSFTSNQFRLSLTPGGAAIDLTSTGVCTVGKQDLHGGIGIYASLTKGGIMGCYIDTCNHGEQTVRIPFIDRSHISNNYIARPNQTKNALKIHSVIHLYFPVWSEKFTISANHITERGGYNWDGVNINRGYERIVGIGSGGNGGVGGEWVRNGIFENNYIESSLGKPKDSLVGMLIGCPNFTARNNICDFSVGDRVNGTTGDYAYTQLAFADIGTGTADQTVGVRLYNNTLFSNYTSAELAVFATVIAPTGGNPQADTIIVQNNILYLPNHSSGINRQTLKQYPGSTATNITTTHNTDEVSTIATTPNFVAYPPVALTDWRTTTGYTINNGTSVPVLRDFNNANRYGSTYDLGAVLP